MEKIDQEIFAKILKKSCISFIVYRIPFHLDDFVEKLFVLVEITIENVVQKAT